MKIAITEGSTAAGAHSGTRREDRSRRSEGAPALLDPSLASEELRLPAPFSRLSPPYHDYTDGSSELEYELLLSFGLEPVRARFLLRQVCRAEILQLDASLEQTHREISNLIGFIQRGESEVLTADAMTKAQELKVASANLEHQRIQQETRLHKSSGLVNWTTEQPNVAYGNATHC